MKIYPVNSAFRTVDPKTGINQTAPIQNTQAVNHLPAVYPVNYYVSFKSDIPMSDAHKSYLAIAEELYDENKNKPLKDVSLDSLQIEFDFNRISDSFLLDKAVRDLITRFINHNAVDPEVDNDFIKKCLKIGLYAIESTETADELFQKGCKRRIVYPFDRARYDYEDLLGDGFRHQGVFSQLSGLLDPTKIKDCKNADELDIYRRVFNTIMPMYIKENYKRPSFDEDFFKLLKKEIDDFEQLREYDKKIVEVKAQEAQNKGISSEKYAQEIYDDVVNKHISPFENEKFYEYLTKNSAKLDFLLEKLYGFYTDDYREAFDSINIDKKHKILLADPGVAFYIKELGEFVDTSNIDTKNISPFELRKKFSDYLGTETVYRGLKPGCTSAEDLAQKIKETGNFAPAFQTKQKVTDNIKYYLDFSENRDDTHFGRIIAKIKRQDKESEFLSVSSEYDIAASVPKDNEGEKSVVIKAQVPVLSILKQKNEYRDMQTSRRHDVLRVGWRPFDYDTQQEKIEAFIPFYIAPENMEVSIDTETPTFKWEND